MSKDFDIHEWRLYQANLNLLNEEEEEWKFTAGPEWNEKELKVGSIITPDMWEASKISNSKYDVLLKSQNKLEEYTKIGGDWYVLLIDSSDFKMYWGVNMLNDWLKPGYKIVLPDNLNEEEEDWDLEAGPEWNVKELSIGDYITPEMFQDNKHGNVFKSLNQNFKIVKFKVDDTILPNGNVNRLYDFDIEYKGRFDTKQTTRFQVKSFNDNLLKPEFQVVPPDNLNEEEDDWNFTAGPEWGVKELGVGDTIIGDMWDWEKITNWNNQLSGDNPEALNKLIDWWKNIYDEGVTINLIKDDFEPYVQVKSDSVNWVISLKTINNLLSPEYKLLKPLNEQDEDEFSQEFIAGDEWNVTDLNVGDVVTPEMWNHNKIENISSNIIRDKEWFYQPHKITKFRQTYLDFVIFDNNKELSLNFVKDFLKPTFKINFNGLNEQDDEWDLEAGPEWDEKTLKVGDKLTPEMFQDRTTGKHWSGVLDLTIKKIDWKNNKLTIIAKYNDGSVNKATWDLEWTIKELNPGFEFDRPLNEQDDEWDLEAGPEWNEKELTVGDTFIINGEKFTITDFIDKKYFVNDNSLENVRVTRHKDNKSVVFPKKYIEKRLPAYTVLVKPTKLNELLETDDEWEFEAGKEWNEKEIKVGDYWYESSNPEWNGVWSNYYDIPDRISDLVLKVIYIGPHKEEFSKPPYNDIPNYFGDNIIISKRNGKFWAFTVDYFNNNFGKKLNAYVPTDNLNEQDDEWDLEAGPEWNEKELGVGDTVTRDMFEPGTEKYWMGDYDQKVINRFTHDNVVHLVDKDGNKIDIWDVYFVNKDLKDPYLIVNSLTESDDEWDLEAGPEWNETLLSLGDKITPDMWDEKAVIDAGEEDEFLEGETWTIIEIDNTWISIKSNGGGFLSWDIDSVQALLKPQYRIVFKKDLFEEEDEFSQEFIAGDEWNVKGLSIGDYITPEMWNKNIYSKSWRKLNQDIKIIDFEKGVSLPKWFVAEYIDSNGGLKQDKVNIDFFNAYILKPRYEVIPPNKLREQDDEWDFEAGPEWNVKDLNVGDIVTPDMWDEDKLRYFEDNISSPLFFTKPHKITRIEKTYFDFVWFDNEKKENFNFVNNLLKPQYRIVQPLNEQEDEDWDFEAGDEWNVTELGIDDTITPNMWNKNLSPEYGNIEDWIDDPTEDQIIDGIDTDDYGVVGIWFTGKKSNIQNIYTLMDFNNLLDPKYRIIPPLHEQEENDWDFEAGDEWNVQELTTGDVITPNMWNNDLPDEWYDEFQEWEMEIADFRSDNEIVVLLGPGTYYLELEDINSYLEPKYKVIPPLNEQEDDEWDLEAGEEWNTKELTTGDYITPDMWDWQEIGAFIDRMNDDDHEEYRRDWEEWEEGTKNPIKILKIYGSGDSTYPELDSYIFRWGPNIRFINRMLKPGFEVIST